MRNSTGVKLRAGDTDITAQLFIAADGANSSIRTKLGVTPAGSKRSNRRSPRSSRPSATMATWRGSVSCKDGPLALLPLPSRDGRFFSSVVWSQTDAVAQQLMTLDDAAFIARLNQCDRRPLRRYPRGRQTLQLPARTTRCEQLPAGAARVAGRRCRARAAPARGARRESRLRRSPRNSPRGRRTLKRPISATTSCGKASRAVAVCAPK